MLLSTGRYYQTGAGGGGPAPDPHRYWRLYMHWNERDNGFAYITECELRETISGADATGSGTPSASSNSGTAGKAFDNSTVDGWGSGSGFPHWLSYDFGAGSEKDINEVSITSRPSSAGDEAPRDWSLQYSDDGSSWTTKWSIYGEDGWGNLETRVYSDPNVPDLYVYPGIVDAHDILGSAMRSWHAADRITGSGGDAQIKWHDISGQGYYLNQRGTSTKRPTLVAASLNSLNTVRWTAANSQEMLVPNPLLSGVSAASMYIVIKQQADPAASDGTSGWGRIGTGSFPAQWPHTGGNVFDHFASTSRRDLGNPSVSLASWRIINVHSAASSYRFFIDGGAGGSSGGTSPFYSTGSNTVGITSMPVIGDAEFGCFLDAEVAEIVFSNADDGTTERQKMEGYLAHKWALTGNLDSSHPYKSSAP